MRKTGMLCISVYNIPVFSDTEARVSCRSIVSIGHGFLLSGRLHV